MRKVHAAFVLCHLAAFTTAAILSSALIAQQPEIVAGWTIYKEQHACSLGQTTKHSFYYITATAEGRNFLRFHDKRWHFIVGHLAKIHLLVGGEPLEVLGTGATTTNGWEGFIAAPQKNVFSALSSNERASMSTDEIPPVDIDLSGLREAWPRLMECVAPLTKRDPAQLPVKGPQLLRQPSIAPSDITSGDQPNGPVTYELTVDANGIPSGCTIINSSGSASIDERICTILRERARFKPALNSAGLPIASSFRSKVVF